MYRRTRSSVEEVANMAPYLNQIQNSAFLRAVDRKNLEELAQHTKTRSEFTLKRISSIEAMLNVLKSALGSLLSCNPDNSSALDLFHQLEQLPLRRKQEKNKQIKKIIYAFEAMNSAYQATFNTSNIPVTLSGLDVLSHKLEIAKLELSVIDKNDLQHPQQETFQAHTNSLKKIVHERYPNKKPLDDQMRKQFRETQALLKDTQSKILAILTKDLNASDLTKGLNASDSLKIFRADHDPNLKDFIKKRKLTLSDYEKLVKIVPIYKQLVQRFEYILLKMHKHLDTEDSLAKQNNLREIESLEIEFLIDTLCSKLECFTQFLGTYTTDLMHNEIFLISLFLAQNSRLTPKLCLTFFKAGLRIPLLYVLDKNPEIIESITKSSNSNSYFKDPPTNFLNALHKWAQDNGFPAQATMLTNLIQGNTRSINSCPSILSAYANS
jgi:hypothetical protein